MSRWRLLLALSLPLITLWAWRSHVQARRNADRELFFAYVDGPINDYAMGITRAMPLLLKSSPAEYAEARASLARSAQGIRELLKTAPDGWIRSRLEFVLPWHEKAQGLLATLPLKKSALGAWMRDEKEIRDKIIYTLEDVRYESESQWKVTKTRFLELNALIYSLKEAQDAAKNQ